MWNPKLGNVKQRIPMKNLLKKAQGILYRNGMKSPPRSRLKDQHGTYGFVYGHFILLAKDYVYGNVISVHKKTLALGIQHEVPLLIYLNKAGTFYEFDPEEILKDNAGENRKGTAIMVNFSIKKGKKFEFGGVE